MALRQIRKDGDEILRKKSREVNIEDITLEKNQSLIDDMLETMYHYNGVGLAAVQVGILKQIIVIDVDDGKGPYVLINPEKNLLTMTGIGFINSGTYNDRFTSNYTNAYCIYKIEGIY